MGAIGVMGEDCGCCWNWMLANGGWAGELMMEFPDIGVEFAPVTDCFLSTIITISRSCRIICFRSSFSCVLNTPAFRSFWNFWSRREFFFPGKNKMLASYDEPHAACEILQHMRWKTVKMKWRHGDNMKERLITSKNTKLNKIWRT